MIQTAAHDVILKRYDDWINSEVLFRTGVPSRSRLAKSCFFSSAEYFLFAGFESASAAILHVRRIWPLRAEGFLRTGKDGAVRKTKNLRLRVLEQALERAVHPSK